MIWPSEQTLAASISTSNAFPSDIATSRSRASCAGASERLRSWKACSRSSCERFSSSVPLASSTWCGSASSSPRGLRKVLTPTIGREPSCLRISYSMDSSWILPRW